MALLAYEALCLMLGAWLRRPMVAGAILLYGWQRAARVLPGYMDYLTIEKYLRALLPLLPTEREKPTFRSGMMVYIKDELTITAVQASVVLLALAAACIVVSVVALRVREFTRARTVVGG